MIDEDDCGAIGGVKIGRGNRSTRRKPAPAPLYPPQIPIDKTRARTPGRRGGKPATDRLSYGAAFKNNKLVAKLFWLASQCQKFFTHAHTPYYCLQYYAC
jgi:hypothetical protein